MGKVLGKVRGQFTLSNMPSIQQMTLGVLTENGISMNVSPIAAYEDGQLKALKGLMKGKQNERITLLIDYTQKLKKLDTAGGAKQANNNKKVDQGKINEKLAVLNQIIDLLIEDDKAMDGHMFQYSDELDLLRAQYTIIDLAFHCLVFVENARYELKKEYYEILSQVFMRDELRLTNMALNQLMEEIEEKIEVLKQSELNTTEGTLQTKNSGFSLNSVLSEEKQELEYLEKVKAEKLKIATIYQKLLYQTLDDCLNKFCRKDVEPYLRSYLEICISVAFFRVPRFQVIFLECIKTADKEKLLDITEWRNIDWALDEEKDSTKRETEFSGIFKLFDWEIQFFKYIPKTGLHQKDAEESVRLLRRIEANKKWQTRVKKRGIAYFQIIKRWAELLKNTVKTFSLVWQDIPGYRCIVKSVLQELKFRKVSEYPDTLIEAANTLVENP